MPTLTEAPEVSTPVAPALRLELTRVIKAPRPRVFDAWTRPDVMRQWLAPRHMATPIAEANPVEGGAYFLQMQGTRPEAEATHPSQSVNHIGRVSGTYTKVSPYDLLQFTWNPEWATGESSLVTLYFRDVEGGTELRLVHEKIASESGCQGYSEGWNGCMAKLAELLEA